jgi:hypothetical protein
MSSEKVALIVVVLFTPVVPLSGVTDVTTGIVAVAVSKFQVVSDWGLIPSVSATAVVTVTV